MQVFDPCIKGVWIRVDQKSQIDIWWGGFDKAENLLLCNQLEQRFGLQPTFSIYLLKKGNPEPKHNKTENRFPSPTCFWTSMSQFPQSIQTRMAEALAKYIARTASVSKNCIFITNKVKSLNSQKKYFSHRQIIKSEDNILYSSNYNNGDLYVEKTDQCNLCQILTKTSQDSILSLAVSMWHSRKTDCSHWVCFFDVIVFCKPK